MLELLHRPWPWYVTGPLLGLVASGLLVIGNKQLGVSGNFRHLCAAVFPRNVAFFKYDWTRSGLWNLAFAGGIVVGGLIGGALLASHEPVAISARAHADLASLGLHDFTGLVPRQLFHWGALLTLKGLLLIAGGGFLIGFGGLYLYGVFASALAVAIPLFWMLERRRVRSLVGEPIVIAPKALGRGRRYAIGGTIFGLGWGVTGACPGPLFALLGAGVGVIAAMILGALAGTWVYGYLRPTLPH